MIEFPFKKVLSKNLGEIARPIIPVTIRGPRRSVQVSMLLDSGADISLLPYAIGSAIGLEVDLDRRREIHGIGEGGVAYILSDVTLGIGDYETPARVGWSLIEEVPPILGRLDIFQQFSIEFIEFREREGQIVLKREKDSGTEQESTSSWSRSSRSSSSTGPSSSRTAASPSRRRGRPLSSSGPWRSRR
jgi:hypothetical protein